jgi:hypothetical protein
MTPRRWRVVGGTCACALLAAAPSAWAQSLGDVARREAERRQAIAVPARVYTEQDLQPARRDPSPTSASNTGRASGSDPTSATMPAHDPLGVARPAASGRAVTVASDAVSARAAVPRAADPRVADAAATGLAVSRPSTPIARPAFATTTSASLRAPRTPTVVQGESLSALAVFDIRKTPEELAAEAKRAAAEAITPRTTTADVRLPPQSDRFHLTTGLGYLQGADWGSEVLGAGRLFGYNANGSLFLTAGALGLQSRSGRVTVVDPLTGVGVEAGDMSSDLRGFARGARMSWRQGEGQRAALSLYLPGRISGPGPAVVALRDEWVINKSGALAGEVASNGGLFVRSRLHQRRAGVDLYYRRRPEISGHDEGVSSSLELGRGIGVTGAVRWSDSPSDTSTWKLVSVRVPLHRSADLTVERNWWDQAEAQNSATSIAVSMMAGPVRLMQRVQLGQSAYIRGGLPVGFDRRQSQSSAAYSPVRWASLSYQSSTQWTDDGRAQVWDELVANMRVGQHTQMQMVTAVSDLGNRSRLRARLTHDLPRGFQLDAQAGRLSAFQSTRGFDSEQPRLLVMVRKRWDVETPARGGDVQGQVLDEAGEPVSNALVRLGSYKAVSDSDGRYRFPRVPTGVLPLSLDREKLPVSYAWAGTPEPITVTPRTRATTDFHVIPLNTISGHVYQDLNGNGVFDEGEGVARAVVSLDRATTATDEQGRFSFYNQPPGGWTIRVDVSRLVPRLEPVGGGQREIELRPDRPLLGVDLAVHSVDKPVLMQELPR